MFVSVWCMKRYSRDIMKRACGENPEDVFSLWEENLCDVITGKEGGHRWATHEKRSCFWNWAVLSGVPGYAAGVWGGGVLVLTFPFDTVFSDPGFSLLGRWDGTEGGAGSAPAKPSLIAVMWKIPLLEGQVWIIQSKRWQSKKASLTIPISILGLFWGYLEFLNNQHSVH